MSGYRKDPIFTGRRKALSASQNHEESREQFAVGCRAGEFGLGIRHLLKPVLFMHVWGKSN